jgi:phosphorylase/glycogen(starch) synthase
VRVSHPQVLFEISWEVCNMVGGIHTVLATKLDRMLDYYGDDYIVVGPDLSRPETAPPVFQEEIWDERMAARLATLGVGCRMGRWLVPGEPRCLLINSSALVSKKDAILAGLWENYHVDSLFGGWDYLEPVLFGRAVGQVIEDLNEHFYQPAGRQVVVHAHEWITGSSLLYLKRHSPNVGTVFTTHATVLGRSLASSRREAELFTLAPDPARWAREMNVMAKHSLESATAQHADVFTTVSFITAEECTRFLGRAPDIITPNGLGDAVPPPELGTLEARQEARRNLLRLAGITTGLKYEEDCEIFWSAGRYEYVNKGVDAFIDALKMLESRMPAGKRALAFFFYPTGHEGPRRELLDALRQGGAVNPPGVCTHDLREKNSDPLMHRLGDLEFTNAPEKPIHIINAPIYLDGLDPLIAQRYYELLPGADLTIFASYYEPWGYTPSESVAYAVPTITTDLSGFGRWAEQRGGWFASGVRVLPRKGHPYEDTVRDLATAMAEFAALPPERRKLLREAARQTAVAMRWEVFAPQYFEAHNLAASKSSQRAVPKTQVVSEPMELPRSETSTHLRSFLVLNDLPAAIDRLRELAENFWTKWHEPAVALFAGLDPEGWARAKGNPVIFLEAVAPEKLTQAAASPDFLARLAAVLAEFDQAASRYQKPEVAYFSAEFGIDERLPTYSGGLGVLAGDFLKAASDLGIRTVGVTLAYTLGYFKQHITRDGSQEVNHVHCDFRTAGLHPVVDAGQRPVAISVPFPGGPVVLQAWRAAVGRNDLYFLDADIEANRPAVRGLTHTLYGGDQQNRLRQEFLLGVGGYKLLTALGIEPAVYHLNEGHCSFLVLARMAHLMKTRHLKFHEALDYVRQTTVFTTHTPVAAGHDRFPEELVRPYLSPLLDTLHKDWRFLYEMAASAAPEGGTGFSMTHLAMRTARHVNGVSAIHGKVSRAMFRDLFPGALEQEIPVDHITNGVHTATWLSPEFKTLYRDRYGPDWQTTLSQPDALDRLREIPDDEFWHAHQSAKANLVRWLKHHIRKTWPQRLERPAHLVTVLETLDQEALVVGFARRFAPYKRGELIFKHLDMLERIVNEAERPVVFIFAGKAHPADGEGQAIIRRVVEMSRRPELAGRIVFIENYDMGVAKLLVAGCDVWLNTPTRPLEASGTSGMKAGVNGCLNLSVADGWWPEAYNGKNGWIIAEDVPDVPREYQDEYDSAQLYSILEQEVIPLYWDRDVRGLPSGWVDRMRHSIASIFGPFSAARMVSDYDAKFYTLARQASRDLAADGFTMLYTVNEFERRLMQHWGDLAFADVRIDGLQHEHVRAGKNIEIRIRLQHPGLTRDDLFVEAVVSGEEGTPPSFEKFPLRCIEENPNDSGSIWEGKIPAGKPGRHSFGIRILPGNPGFDGYTDVATRLVKWL